MLSKILISLAGILLITQFCYGACLWETDQFVLSVDTYLRTDLVSFKNVVDLDSSNSDDSTTYLGIDYSLGVGLESPDKEKRFYLKLERNGPYDYDAPLFVHNTLMTSGGVIEKYRNEELLPQVEEFWLDLPLFNPLRFKLGLYTYSVGNGFSLNGCYENFGLTLFRETQDFTWRLYYSRPDLSNKIHLGPRIRQEIEQGIVYEPNAANFFAWDITFKKGESFLQPYVGALVDYTSNGKRDNLFATPTDKEILGTTGIAWTVKQSDLSWTIELAHNFGLAESSNPEYKDVYHTGYLIYTELGYKVDRFNPIFAFLVASGNKVTLDAAQNQDSTLTSSKNRAFSNYSPLNKNLGDSVSCSNVDMLPIVAMGGGYGLNYGVARPTTFAAADFENLIMPSLGFDFKIQENLELGLYGYYLWAFEKPVGVLGGTARYLSKDLGSEIDLFIDYQLNQNILISILAGYFFPGRYYRELRDSTDETLFNPFVRPDGHTDNAYQIELAVEFRF
jgi:hypothetical protein